MATQVEHLCQAGAKEADGPLSQQAWSPSSGNVAHVWRHNLDDEVERMASMAESYPYIALDAQLPGIVAQPTGPFGNYLDYNYQTLKVNVDMTKVLQVGLAFSNETGDSPTPEEGPSLWRFNFHFDPRRDLASQDPMELRRKELDRHCTEGIDPATFAEALSSSGLVLNEDIRWITYSGSKDFHHKAGAGLASKQEPPWVTFAGLYDFGHLIKMLTDELLPPQMSGFLENLDMFFPTRCDLAKHANQLSHLRNYTRQRTFYRKAPHLLQVFFHLPESVRRTAFDPEEEAEEPAEGSAPDAGSHGLTFQ
mmetsp:Transcript_55980/g.122364  ORF Transcript_55980/g.122364 Transcript_55980/m.122364 type:complete len:308 (-) Transcript_55980:129-1052(-)